MQFKLLSVLALAGLAAAAPSAKATKDLPDGPYSGVNHADGSSTLTNVETGQTFEIAASAKSEKRSLDKRYTSCWGYELDHTGVDQAVFELKNWAGNGRDWSSDKKPSYYGINYRGVYVYYCINGPHSSGNLDTVDINYALERMDSTCKRYEAGYFQWDGSVELVGKTRSGTAVCLG
ncbi:hypothetical protein ACHAPU_000940 [Fusarium lateritium]